MARLTELSDDDRELLMLVAWEGLGPAQRGVVLGSGDLVSKTKDVGAQNGVGGSVAHQGVGWTRDAKGDPRAKPRSATARNGRRQSPLRHRHFFRGMLIESRSCWSGSEPRSNWRS